MVNDKIKEINLFIDGVASVCNDINVIAEKTQNYFGKNFKRFVDYVLIMKYRTFSAEQFAKILCKRDLSEGLSGIEIECAKRSGLVIVSGYSDDVIELKGTIFAVGDCFDGGDFHLKREKGKWNLERGVGKNNNISALWYDQDALTDDGEPIPWSYKTDIPHESFIATNDGEPFSEGFVFDIHDLIARTGHSTSTKKSSRFSPYSA